MWELSRLGYMGKVTKKSNAQEEIQEVNIEVNDR
jgi:hypothetical protein